MERQRPLDQCDARGAVAVAEAYDSQELQRIEILWIQLERTLIAARGVGRPLGPLVAQALLHQGIGGTGGRGAHSSGLTQFSIIAATRWLSMVISTGPTPGRMTETRTGLPLASRSRSISKRSESTTIAPSTWCRTSPGLSPIFVRSSGSVPGSMTIPRN